MLSKPGRELDKFICKKVFGFDTLYDPNVVGDGWCFFDSKNTAHPLYHFSTDLDDSYKLVEFITSRYGLEFYCSTDDTYSPVQYHVGFHPPDSGETRVVIGEDLCHLISVAAINTVSNHSE